jgi:hypothetical protein
MSHSRIEEDQNGRERDQVRRHHKPDPDVEQPGEARDAGWNRIRWRRFDTSPHPQETTENSIDLGHFTQVHGFVDASVTRAIEVEGPLLTLVATGAAAPPLREAVLSARRGDR